MHRRTCPECGAVFAPLYNQQVCCGEVCRMTRARRLKKECDARRKSTPGLLGNRHFRRRLLSEKKSAARRRAEFFAARDAAFARAGLPPPRIEVEGGVVTEYRGRCAGGPAPTRIPDCR